MRAAVRNERSLPETLAQTNSARLSPWGGIIYRTYSNRAQLQVPFRHARDFYASVPIRSSILELRSARRGNDSCLPLFCIALRREIEACSTAVRPKEVLSSYTLMTIGEPQQLGQRSAHDHFARVRRKSARIEQGAILIHDRLYFLQISVRSKDNLDKRARVAVRCRSEERRVGKECRSRWSPDH